MSWTDSTFVLKQKTTETKQQKKSISIVLFSYPNWSDTVPNFEIPRKSSLKSVLRHKGGLFRLT